MGSAPAALRLSVPSATTRPASAFGQPKGRSGRAIKVWDKREFKDLDGGIELGTRNIKLALRRLRRFARQGAADELDLDSTIKKQPTKAISTSSSGPSVATRSRC